MSHRPSLRAIAWRWRRLIIATALAAVVALTIHALGRTAGTTASIYVAGRDLPAGHELARDDLVARAAPEGLIPSALEPEQAEGSRLAIGLPEGSPLTSAHLLGPSLADHAPAGTVVIPVPLASPPDLTPVGATVELWAAPTDELGGEARRLASGATIMAFAPDHGTSAFRTQTDVTRAYVAVSPREARLVLGISARAPVLAVLAAAGAP
ncbi:MAG: SAF domain-containing protein [Flaviflexus sp.]|nr:SAF domain-containing protein [Flaviflexus sp.]